MRHRLRRWLLIGAFVAMPAPAHSRQSVATLSGEPHDAPAGGPQDTRSRSVGPAYVVNVDRQPAGDYSYE
jgi:hypothetical protein